MSKNLEHLKAQLNAVTELRAWIAGEIAELEAPKAEKWEPKEGEFYIHNSGNVKEYLSAPLSQRFGVERETLAKAEAAMGRMRTFNRLDAWIDESVDGDVPCQVEFDKTSIAVVRYMPSDSVMALEKLVKNGVVVL